MEEGGQQEHDSQQVNGAPPVKPVELRRVPERGDNHCACEQPPPPFFGLGPCHQPVVQVEHQQEGQDAGASCEHMWSRTQFDLDDPKRDTKCHDQKASEPDVEPVPAFPKSPCR